MLLVLYLNGLNACLPTEPVLQSYLHSFLRRIAFITPIALSVFLPEVKKGFASQAVNVETARKGGRFAGWLKAVW